MFGFIKRLFGPSVNYKELVSAGAIIVDVRTPEEYQAGHIQGSRNIPLNKLQQELPQLKEKNKAVITVCRSGARSGMGKNILKASGIETYNGGPWNSLEQKLG